MSNKKQTATGSHFRRDWRETLTPGERNMLGYAERYVSDRGERADYSYRLIVRLAKMLDRDGEREKSVIAEGDGNAASYPTIKDPTARESDD